MTRPAARPGPRPAIPEGPVGPFEDPAVVGRYEDWYASPFGALADALEKDLLARLLRGVPAGGRLLEVGCGTGHFGADLRSKGFRVTGTDVARTMLGVAAPRLPVVQADAARLPFRANQFDGAFLVALLDFVPDPLAVLREARRVTRGEVAVLALVSHSAIALRRRLAAWRGNPIFRTARFYSRRALLGLAREALEPEERTLPIEWHQILTLPPFLAARAPRLERWLSGRDLACGGLLGMRLPRRAD